MTHGSVSNKNGGGVMKVFARLCLAFIVAGWLAGCATVTRGTHEAFVVESDPSGADVQLSTGLTCKTPCSLKVSRKDGFTVHVTKSGYEPIETHIVAQTANSGAAGMAGNVLLGGLIGAAVDAG